MDTRKSIGMAPCLHNRDGWDAKRFEIVFHQIRYADILAQHSAARHDHGRIPFAVKFRCMKSAIRRVIVVAEDNQRIRLRGRFIHHPKLPGKAHQWMPGNVQNGQKTKKKQKK